jgi:diguanylate cyclase (GGDEF)-like protein
MDGRIGNLMADKPRGKTEVGLYFWGQHLGRWLALGTVLLVLIFIVDYKTDFVLHLAPAYLLPILIFTWNLGRLFGIILSVTACGVWAWFDGRSGIYAGHAGLFFWEWGSVLAAFLLLVIGLTALRKALLDALFQSRKDALTGLVNMGGFYQIVGAELELCRRYKRTLSIAYIDCDNFKQVNDTFGHHVGDNLLRVIANTMQRKLRGSDLAGRLGGDEFAVMLPETNAEACRMVIEMLQQRLLHEMQENGWPVTFSIGIATFTRMPPSIDDMVRQADKLMYAVKNTSKGAIKHEIFGA